MRRSTRNSDRRIANAIIIPMIVIVTLSVIGIFGLLHWSSRLADVAAAESQSKLIDGALKLTQRYLAKQQNGVATWDEAYRLIDRPNPDRVWLEDNIMRWLDESNGFTRSLLVNRAFEVEASYSHDGKTTWLNEHLFDQLRPAVAKVRARYIRSFTRTPSGLFVYKQAPGISFRSIAETGIVSVRGEPHLFSAAAIMPQIQTISPSRRPPAVLVSMAPLRGEKMRDLTAMSRLKGFVLANTQVERPGVGRYTLTSPRGEPIGIFAWHLSEPGSQMMRRINPFLALSALMIAAVLVAVTLFTRMMTRRLARSEARAVHTAWHDSLSGLPNRSRFQTLLKESLSQSARKGQNAAVIYIDLDHFKDINDTLGHSAGDQVIVAVARRLRRVLPETGIVARISGDEFAMLITDCASDEWLEYILDQLQDEIARPIQIGRRELHASLSMGIAMAPRDGTEADELLRKADIALYDAKANGRGRRAFFEGSMEQHVQSRDELSRDLRLALQNDDLDLAYQPLTDTTGNRVVSVEVLARWTKRDGTVIPPSVFIPVAEETGLIAELGTWVLNRACAKAHDFPDITVSVNVSPNQFKHPRFVEKIMAILAANALPPERLEIEVTETVFAGRNDTVLKALRRLKSLGVKVALDDFGSGYSSLSYLRRFPFDTLKIDRDFLSGMDGNPEAEAILVSIIQLGKALGMNVVAEGIETREQIRFLQTHGCDRLQGYFISRPLTETALGDFLEGAGSAAPSAPPRAALG